MKRDTPITLKWDPGARGNCQPCSGRGLKAIADPVAPRIICRARMWCAISSDPSSIWSGQRGRTQAERAQGTVQANALVSNVWAGNPSGRRWNQQRQRARLCLVSRHPMRHRV